MCKVFIATGITRTDLVRKVMESAKPQMSIGNRDGIGYTAVTSDNKMFMQKWHNNDKFLDTETVLTNEDVKSLEPFKKKLSNLSANHETIGNVDLDNVTSFTMHTRYATCGKEFQNTHPFVVGDYSLIHNGIIRNAHKIDLNKISTCDSENALQLFIQDKLNEEISASKIQPFLDAMEGYWAFGIFSKDLLGQYQLDVVKDGANLSFAYIPELGENCVVFATDRQVIIDVCSTLGFNQPLISYVMDHVFNRFNALTGEIIEQIDVEQSVLNKPKYNSYNSYRNYSSFESDDEFEKFFNKVPTKSYMDEINDTLETEENLFELFYDTEIPLEERLSQYDDYMYTTYFESFTKSMPLRLSKLITKQEQNDLIAFDDIILLIEEHNQTGDVKKVLTKYNQIINKKDYKVG